MSEIPKNSSLSNIADSSSKFDIWLYRLSYGSQGLFVAFLGTFFPIYLTYVARFSASQIAVFVFITQFPILLKPVIGIFNDRIISKNPSFPYIMLIISTLTYTLSMIGLGILLQNLQNTIFTVLSLIIYLAYSIFDTMVDFLVVSKQQKDNGTAVANLQFSAGIGSFITSQIYLLIIGVNITTGPWNIFFYIFGMVGGIFFLVAILHPKKSVSIHNTAEPNPETTQKGLSLREKRIVVIVILLSAGLQIPYLTDYVMEPYLVNKFSPAGFNVFVAVGSYSSLLSLPIYFVCAKYRKRIYPYRIQILIGFGIFAIINWIAVGFSPLWLLLIFSVIGGLGQHLIMFSAISILIDATPRVAKATFYQLFAFVWNLSALIFRAIGPLIYDFIGVWIYVLVGILLLGYNLPVFFILNKAMPYKMPEDSPSP